VAALRPVVSEARATSLDDEVIERRAVEPVEGVISLRSV
jgi:hypothetical protein